MSINISEELERNVFEMSFNSIDYLFFFPIVVLLYYVIPEKFRMYWLLIASYYFYMSWNAKYGLLLLFSTVVTYICGMAMEVFKKQGDNKKNVKLIILFGGVVVNLGLLFFFKYTYFAIDSVNSLILKLGHSRQFSNYDIVLPVGISFFIFQALGYTIDVYRGQITAEKNLFRYALFVSFFPQLVAGPIERSGNLLTQLQKNHRFDVDNVKNGLLIMAYGLFMKIAVADNISPIVDNVFENSQYYTGMKLLFVTILFAFQIYCDFNGYTQIAIGSALVLGLKLNQNFDVPYMGMSVKDFWRRWHISLTSWFRDYLYIPLGGSRKGKIRKQINTMIVFLCSGLWHGAAWHFVIWGGLNGLFSVLEDILAPIKRKIHAKLLIDTELFMYKLYRRVLTFVLIDFAWLFFRANSIGTAIEILKKIAGDIRLAWLINFDFIELFAGPRELLKLFVPLIVIVIIDIIKYLGKDIKAIIFKQQIVFRWMIYAGIMLAILYWGVYGTGFEQTQFIYFQF